MPLVAVYQQPTYFFWKKLYKLCSITETLGLSSCIYDTFTSEWRLLHPYMYISWHTATQLLPCWAFCARVTDVRTWPLKISTMPKSPVGLAQALIAHIAEVLAHHCISSKFNDSYCYLSAVFCISQNNHSPLEEITLGDNRIGDVGIEELARRLGTVRTPSLHPENVP